MAKKEVISTTREQQQRYLMNCAKISIASRGRQWEARADIISMLRVLKDDDVIKNRFDEECKKYYHKDSIQVLNDFNDALGELVSYYSDIKKRVLDQEDVSSVRFIRYKQAMSKCYKYLFFVDKLIVFLVKDTSLEDLTIPSHYFMYVSKDEIKLPEEAEEMGTFMEEDDTDESDEN